MCLLSVLGYTFAVLPVLAFLQTGDSRLFLVGILCVAPFVLDPTVTMLRRAIQRENILQAHRSHLYQRLVRRGHSHGQVSLLYTALALCWGWLFSGDEDETSRLEVMSPQS